MCVLTTLMYDSGFDDTECILLLAHGLRMYNRRADAPSVDCKRASKASLPSLSTVYAIVC